MSAAIVMDAGVPVTGSIEVAISTPIALSNDDDTGILGWQWTLLDRPAGSSAVLSSPTSPTSSITPDVEGTYLIRLETFTDIGHTIPDADDTQAAGVRYTGSYTWRLPASGETIQYSSRGWTAEVNNILDETRTGLIAGSALTLTGDVTGSGTGSFATTISTNVVTNAKLADVATQTIKGRTTAGSGDPEDLTATQATAILNTMVGDSGSGGTKGLVPAPASGDAAANKFLKANGAWAVAGGVNGPVSSTNNAIATWNGTLGDTLNDTGLTVITTTLSATSAATVNVKGGDRTSGTGSGGILNLTGGAAANLSGGNAVGAAVVITGGAGAANRGGGVSVLGGSPVGSGSGSPILIQAGPALGGGGAGGTIDILGSTGVTGAFNGSSINITAGASSSATGTGSPGRVNITGGAKLNGGSHSPGGITLDGGSGGGDLWFKGGAGSTQGTTGRDGGDVVIEPGDASVYISGGTGGLFRVTSGNGYGGGAASNGVAGPISLICGTAGSHASFAAVAGANITLTAGNASTNSTVSNAAGGNFLVTAGNARNTAQGGFFSFKPGSGSSATNDGYFILARNSANRACALQFEGDDGDEISIKAPAAVTPYAMTWPAAQGTSGQVLTNSDGAGTLTWTTPSGGSPVINSSVQTTDATVTTIATYATSTNDAIYVIDVSFAGIDKTANEIYERGMRAVVIRDETSTLTVRNVNNYSTYGDDLTWDATIDVSGTDIRLRVQGDATNAVEWNVKGDVIEHS